jgi:hypothetical protein
LRDCQWPTGPGTADVLRVRRAGESAAAAVNLNGKSAGRPGRAITVQRRSKSGNNFTQETVTVT